MPYRICIVLSLMFIAANSSQAATVTIYSTLGSFLTGLGGAPTQTQDFSALAIGTNLLGFNILPGVTATTANAGGLEVFDADKVMFSFAAGAANRTNPAYTLNIGGAYNGFAFDIADWNPAAPGTLDLIIIFADADVRVVSLTRPGGVIETTPQFFGVIGSVGITSIALNEPLEVGGTACCEEVALDNLVAAETIPEPATYTLAGLGLIALALIRRKRSNRP